MLFETKRFGALLSIAVAANAHFTLEYPTAIGDYSDVNLATGPCDGYDPTKVTVFQDYPWRGEAIALFTTHPDVSWNFNVALFSEVKNDQSAFVPMTEDVKQNNGTGAFCFGQVPGKKEWLGQKAIIQMIQDAPDGKLYSCIAVTFTDSAPDNGGTSCYNISGPGMLPYDIYWLPGTGSDLYVVTSSSTSASSTATSATSVSTSSTEGTMKTSSSSESMTKSSGMSSTSSTASNGGTGSTASSASASMSGTATGSPSSASMSSGASGMMSSTKSSTEVTGAGSPTSSASGGRSSTTSNSTSATTPTPNTFTGDSTKLPVTGLWIITGLFLAGLTAVGL